MPSQINQEIYIVLTTAPDQATAKKLSMALVEQKLAACVHTYPAVEATYHWQDKITVDKEIPIMIKTTQHKLADVEALINELHPYDVPEFVYMPANASQKYLAWLHSFCKDSN